jgi:xanthine/uracil permease
MWLDADGSMTALAIKDILLKLQEDKNAVVIGSRFVNGGGYKGVLDIEKTSFFTAIKNVRKSNDSVLGMIVSIIFNKFLNYIFPYEQEYRESQKQQAPLFS